MARAHVHFLSYTLLPGFWPRLRAFFGRGFVHVSYLLAIIYAATGLLPQNHPYLQPQNFGRFGIRHVIAAAAANLSFRRRNIDQIIVFFVLLTGLVLLGLQVGILIFSLFFHPAMAAGFGEMFGVNALAAYQGGRQDLAFMLMDRVFGTTGIFNSCLSTPADDCYDQYGSINEALPGGNYPFPLHRALHALLEFYSRGIFVVGVFIIIYLVTTIVAEMNMTGSPFGRRFNRAWAPVRLILFFGLLVPLNVGTGNAGLNGAQILTFWVAKTGSNFATNTWFRFNDTITGTYLGEARSLIAKPQTPEIRDLVAFMYVVKTCKVAMEMAYPDLIGGTIQPYAVRERPFFDRDAGAAADPVTQGADALPILEASYEDALRFSHYGNIKIVYGQLDEEKNKAYRGHVRPYCGSVNLLIAATGGRDVNRTGTHAIQQAYYNMIKNMTGDTLMTDFAECNVRRVLQDGHDPNCHFLRGEAVMQAMTEIQRARLETIIPQAIDQQVQNSEWSARDGILQLGWAGASIWYNRIAELNGEVTTAILGIPSAGEYPEIMEYVSERKKMQDEDVDPFNRYQPILADGKPLEMENPADLQVAQVLYDAYAAWNDDDAANAPSARLSDNLFISLLNKIFGTRGIYDMLENPNIHPLAQLSALGNAMTQASIRNIAVGAVGNLFLGKRELPGAISSMLNTVGFAFLLMSFILSHILPLMPFIYFMFALGGWLKSVFEAIVAMPLWALGHVMRVDGNGLSGPGASNGYFMLFEIFLRPVLIVVGMVASIIIFSAAVMVVNGIFNLIIENLSGFNYTHGSGGLYSNFRGRIDQFFFTAMYVVTCYMLGLSCFKLIDQIPDRLLRWMGATTKTFQESNKNAASDLNQRIYIGGNLAMNNLQGGTLSFLLK